MSTNARSLWPAVCAAACLVASWTASGCSTTSNGGAPPVVGSSSGSGSGSSSGSGGSSGSSGGDDASPPQGDATADGADEGVLDAGRFEVNVQDAVFVATDEGVPDSLAFPDSTPPPFDGPRMVDDASIDASGD